MRINLRRGLFRLWLVATVIWITIVAISEIGRVREVIATPPMWGAGDRIVGAHPLGFTLETVAPNDPYQPTATRLWAIAVNMGEIGLIPPGVVLLLGLASSWAVAGFLKHPDSA